MVTNATQEFREVEVKTPLGKDVLLFSHMEMKEALGSPFEIDLELYSNIENITFEDLLGQNVTIRLDAQNDAKRYFNGYVSDFRQSMNSGSFAVYQATLRPWLWLLTRTSDCRIFQFKTVPDIIKQVFRDLGFTDFEEKLSGQYREWEYCVQYRETDFQFVSRLMEQEGIYYYFKHEDGKHLLVLSDGMGAHEPIPEYASIPYFPADSSAVREDEHVYSWALTKQVQAGNFVLSDFDFKKPRADLKVDSVIARGHKEAEHELYDYPGEYEKTGDGDGYVKARLEALHARYEQGEAHSDVRGLMTGGLFTLKEYPREDQNREYLVVSAYHTLSSDEYESTGGDSGMVYHNHFTAVTSSTPYRSPLKTDKPIVKGPQTAIVVGPAGEEICTDENGRVKVQFHWDRYGKSDENSSCWIRVSQLWAGKNWGGLHIPRIGQEVIVDFLEGDPDRPIITGRVYNADQMPPYTLPANKTQSGIQSRSTKGGAKDNCNELRFEDKSGEEQLLIHAEKDQAIEVENDESHSVGRDRKKDIGNDETVSIGGSQTIDVGASLTVTAGQEITFKTGTASIVLTSDGNITIEGAGEILIRGTMITESYTETDLLEPESLLDPEILTAED